MYRIIILCLSTGLLGCDPKVTFNEALPPGIAQLNSIPQLFQGKYICESDSSQIVIDENHIIHITEIFFEGRLDLMESNDACKIVDDGLFITNYNTCIPLEYLPDGRYRAHYYDNDSIFSTNQNIAKLYKGHLFLNIQNNKQDWTTWVITPADDHLTLNLIDIPPIKRTIEDVSEKYTLIKGSTELHNRYILNPTLSELNNLLSSPHILKCDILWKINNKPI